jgi:TRAP-type C4-dicarboxylate transport system permease small subunit
MPKIFLTLDKAKPVFDIVDKVVMLLCKILLVVDIAITCMTVAGRFITKYFPRIQAPSWTEEVVLSCMTYVAVLAAAIAIRRGAHIRMTALDTYLPKTLVKTLDVLSDVCVLALALIMLGVGWQYASNLWNFSYVSMPGVSRFWMYFPIPLAGIAMIFFQVEALYNHIKAFFVKEETPQ